jgi:xanthine dehydrogenase YagR molybdenum-binding subunit
MVAQKLGLGEEAHFADGMVVAGGQLPLAQAARDGAISAEDIIEYGTLDKTYQQSTFASHFVEVAVDGYTGETRIRRMLAVCDAGAS